LNEGDKFSSLHNVLRTGTVLWYPEVIFKSSSLVMRHQVRQGTVRFINCLSELTGIQYRTGIVEI
jgi:hypothetical protein